MVKDATK